LFVLLDILVIVVAVVVVILGLRCGGEYGVQR
jgi:hypothetical protein